MTAALPGAPPLRVALVALTAGGFSGGFAKYLRCLVPRLRREPRIGELRLVAPSGLLASLRERGVIGDGEGHATGGGAREISSAVRLMRPDVVFVPTARALAALAAPQVIMVRNMEPFEAPFAGLAWHGALRNAGRLLAARRACRRADHVIAVSRHVASVLEGRLRVPRHKLAVVYHGVDAPGDDPGLRPSSAPQDDRPFLFTAGSIRPARGLDDLVEALRLAGAAAPLLWIAGASDPDAEAYARAAAAQGRAQRARRPHALPRSHRRAGDALVLPQRQRLRDDEPRRGLSQHGPRGARPWLRRGLDGPPSDA